MTVSLTRTVDVLPEHVLENVDDGVRDGFLHGFEEASAGANVLLWGPPGSGKTTESLARLAVFVNENDVDALDTTVVTYRSSLADSIITRAKKWGVFGVDADADDDDDDKNPFKYWGTGHAVACRSTGFLDRFNVDDDDDDENNLPKHAGMVDTAAKRAFCEAHGIQFSTGVPWAESQWDVFHALYTYCKQNLLRVGTWSIPETELLGTIDSDAQARELRSEFREKWGGASFPVAVEKWESWKRANECYDFYEQLTASFDAELPATDYVIIDELHDAYPLLTRVFENWIEQADTVIVAGDPDQVCNSFSGAHPAIFEGLPNRVDTDLNALKLPRSHRVPDEHFNAAARVLSTHRRPPRLQTAGRGELHRHIPGGKMRVKDGEWTQLADSDNGSPVQLVNECGTNIMFLARTQMLVDAVGACLDYAGFMYKSQDNVAGNWELRRDIINALRKVETVRPAQQTALNSDYAETQKHNNVTDTPESSTLVLGYDEARALINHSDERLLNDSRSECLTRVTECERSEDPVRMVDVDDMVDREWWTVYGQGRGSIDNLVYLSKKSGFTGTRDRDVTAMQRAWTRYDTLPVVDDLPTKLWTLHASKGDEAEHVAVFTGVTGRVRDGVRSSTETAENEARTWYVALTRAKKSLHIVRDAFDITCDNYSVLPADLEAVAARTAQKQRAARADGGDSQ